MSSILDNPEGAETILLTLLKAKTDQLVTFSDAPAPLVHYAHRWLKLVGEELRDELNEGLRKQPQHLRGNECTLTVLGAVKDSKDAHWVTIKTKDSAADDDGDETPDPPIMHALVLSAEDVVYYISGYQPDRRGDKFRAVPMDAEALRLARVTAPRSLPSVKQKCVELASASTALQRVHALCSISKLDPALAAALAFDEKGAAPSATPSLTASAPSPWRPLDDTDAQQQQQVRKLNPGQRAALRGLDGPVSIVQGPPGTGKSMFITAACLSRVPPGSRILACTATNKAIDSLVAKFESAGLTEMLTVGSRRAMGEASCRYLMSSVLARERHVGEAEAVYAEHMARVRELEAQLNALPKVNAVELAELEALVGVKGGAGDKGGGGKSGRGRGSRRQGEGGKGGSDGGQPSAADGDAPEGGEGGAGEGAAAAPAAAAAGADGAAEGEGAVEGATLSAEEAAEAAAVAAAAKKAAAAAAEEARLRLAELRKQEGARAAIKSQLKNEQVRGIGSIEPR